MGKLKGAANSIAQSFNSLMNYSASDYVMEIISGTMAKKGIGKAELDLLSGKAKPHTILTAGTEGAIPIYRKMLDSQLGLSHRSLEDVESARITIQKTGKVRGEWKEYEVSCAIVLKSGQRAEGKSKAKWLERGGRAEKKPRGIPLGKALGLAALSVAVVAGVFLLAELLLE